MLLIGAEGGNVLLLKVSELIDEGIVMEVIGSFGDRAMRSE